RLTTPPNQPRHPKSRIAPQRHGWRSISLVLNTGNIAAIRVTFEDLKSAKWCPRRLAITKSMTKPPETSLDIIGERIELYT
ncbi:MAG: hypothetical protein WCG92_20040, partial [Hyphomicrobiales bacterium]